MLGLQKCNFMSNHKSRGADISTPNSNQHLQTMTRYVSGSATRSRGPSAWLRSFWLLFLACGLAALILCVAERSNNPGSATNRAPHLRRRQALRDQDKLPSGIRRPPQTPLLLNDSPETIKGIQDKFAASEKRVVDDIVKSVDPVNATFENTIIPYVSQFDQSQRLLAPLAIYSALTDDEKLKDAVDSTQPNIDAAYQKTILNESFYNLVDAVFQKQKDDKTLTAESRLLLANFHEDFENAGLKITDKEKRQRYFDNDERISQLSRDFENAITDDQSALWFTEDELIGTHPETIKELEKGTGEHEGKLKVIIQAPQSSDIFSYCTNSTTRQQLAIAYTNLAPSNVETLKQIIVLRDEQARALEWPNYATWRIKDNMAKTPEAVSEFLDRVKTNMTPAADEQSKQLKSIKKNDTGNADYLFDWDWSYYRRILAEQKYKTNPEFVKEFFPAVQTLRKVLDLYAELFSLKFIKIEGKDADALSPTGKGADILWHPDVELYAVWEGKGDDFVGYFYLDIFYRASKVPGAFMLMAEDGHHAHEGKRHYPSAALVTGSKKAADDADKPTLLYRSEVEDLLHEAGHAMHQLTSKTQYSRYHGPNGCPIDFVELPSQMMQKWARVPAVLKRFSQHYTYLSEKYLEAWRKANKGQEQPPAVLPDAEIDSTVKALYANAGLEALGETAMEVYDQKIHTPASHAAAQAIDVTELWNSLLYDSKRTWNPKVIGLDPGHGEATFSHLAEAYAASCYGYQWSMVYAADAFHTAFEQDPFSSETGLRWRTTVLEPGGTKDFEEILEEFLGHKPTEEAFYRDLGIGQ